MNVQAPLPDFYPILAAPAYSIAESARLTGLSRWRVSRWLRGYQTEQIDIKPVVKRDIPETSTYASFLDLIDMLFVKEFISIGHSLQYIRKALDEARGYLGSPHFARSRFFTSSNQIILDLPLDGKMVALLSGGQTAMGKVIEQAFLRLDFEQVSEHGFANRWYPDGRDGYIVIDPEICFGRPTVVGRSIATENIYDLFLGEQKQLEPVQDWFELPPPAVEAAVTFELGLAA